MSELFHECGVAAIYFLKGQGSSDLFNDFEPDDAASLIPRMLSDMQNRGQLSAGLTSYMEGRGQLLDTHKEIGTVSEVFRYSHTAKHKSLMQKYAGNAAIGHVRYATCGRDDHSYAQPFERHDLVKSEWFSFAFNGQLANYNELSDELTRDGRHHLARQSDTEVIMHEISRHNSGNGHFALLDMMSKISQRLDGAYSLAYINACGDMLIARDPLGIKPMCVARRGPLIAAASESVALVNLGFNHREIISLKPGHAMTIVDGEVRTERFANSPRHAHCFFEWIYFANVASHLDGRSVYMARTRLGAALAEQEKKQPLFNIDADTIVVPVPDSSRAAADGMAYGLGLPCREGLIRNRASGRTFIEKNQEQRIQQVKLKYTPLPEVMRGKKVILVEDSIVRSTTLQILLKRVYDDGEAAEVHVRVACPPIVAPCFYGIDMSTMDELFAPAMMSEGIMTQSVEQAMATKLGCDSLRYLPVSAIADAIELPQAELCQACITGDYPTPGGTKMYQIALEHRGKGTTRAFDLPNCRPANEPSQTNKMAVEDSKASANIAAAHKS
ncbi:MAG TPA: amidophosphoribosyltransferase [Pirellulaceae bacterium]|nr:amidophosphoribosyltransferase [Pirellulaceae bacterium]HMO91026.1 amidophosphoribosyltransferase [Pirellulaceae bacterium]HMP68141.1 amidophosphoribosyltransferase [Pirellulaceae bacterium]